MTSEPHTRRYVLGAGAAAAGAIGATALASCSGGGDGGGGEQAAPPPSGEALIPLADIPVGQVKQVTAGDQEIIIARPTESSAAAFSAVCTHQGCTVAPSDSVLRCPCHGSEFDPLTGEVRTGPAKEPLPPVSVQVSGGNVVTS